MSQLPATRPGSPGAVAAQKSAQRDIRDFLQSETVKKQVALALPGHLTADRMLRTVVTTMMRVPKLAQCTQMSLLNCVMQCSQFGLEPDGRRAHLIPFENRKTGTVECTLIIDWKGLAELALRSGMIAKLHADVICDKDKFEYDMGDILHHIIDWRSDRGEPYAAYAMAVTKTGERFVVVMQKWEIEKIRDNSQGWRAFKAGYAKQSPWQDAPHEMWKKTAFRRLAKWLPLSAEFRNAQDLDDHIEVTSRVPAVGAQMEIPEFPALPEGDSATPITDTPTDEQPEPTQEPPVEAPKVRRSTRPPESIAAATPQQELESFVLGAGFDFSLLQEWGDVSGNVEGASSLSSFSEVPRDVASRLLRNKAGLLDGLAKTRNVRGGA
jgi:recombination protein RecT